MTRSSISTLPALETDAATGLSYRVIEPQGEARGLLILSHGVGGNETNLMAAAELLPADWRLVFVRSALVLGPGQYAWFAVHFSAQGPQINAEHAESSRRSLLALVASLQDRYGTAPAQTVMAGFSQGGILSASVGLSAPTQVAGFGILSGRILPELEAHLAPAAELGRVEGFVAHGRHDDKLPLAWAERAHDWLDALGVRHELKLYDMGHGLTPDVLRDFSAWLARF